MTIVMEEDGFSSSLSSLSCLSPQQSNYQSQQSATTILTSSSSSSSSSNGIHNSSLNTNSSNSPNSLSDYNGPYALFLFRSNSSLETFEERRISLDKPCKIGRSVAKIKPEPNNAIFDCKVLSRNHALLWHENGKFYIQDTKSSNGTFLNGNRLGKSNEDSAPFDLTSGDIIQFGVDVTENTKKVTHGCITVELKLFFKPGVEATNKTNQSSTSNKIDVQTQEIYQLALFLQEAMMREEILNQKLNSLQKFIDQAKETSENNWLTIIDEDRLLSRIDYLEKQCVLHTKQFTDDSLKKCINNLTNEKFNIETATKQSLEKMIEEKNETAQKLDDLNTTFTIRNDECNKLQQVLDESKTSIIDLAVKYQELLNDLEEQKQNESENKLKLNEKINQFENEKIKYEQLYEESLEKEKLLNAKIESLIADNDFTSKRLEGILNKLEKEKLLADSSSTNLIVNDNNNKQQQMNTTTTISVNNTTTTTGYLNGKQDNNITYECNGFNHNHDNLETSDLNENQESIIKDEPSNLVVVDNHNVSLSKVEVDFAVERIIQKIENHQNVSENENELENQKKINNQLRDEIEMLKLTSITDAKLNLNKSQQTDQSNQVNENQNFENALNIIKNKLELIKNNEIESPENEKLLELFKYLEKSYKQEIDLNLSNSNQNDLDIIKFKTVEELEKDYEERLNKSEEKLKEINIEYDNLSLQTKIVSYCSTIPLLILIFAIMIAFYPTLSAITATGL